MAGKISIVGQIAEIDREIALRRQVYPKRVHEGKMRQEEANMLMDRIQAVRQTLVFCQQHEAEIRAYMAEKKAGAA
ncbi:MAG: hypothetical protein ACK43M_14550 [Allorhizobium sp.]